MVKKSFVLYNHLVQWKLRIFLVVSWQLLEKVLEFVLVHTYKHNLKFILVLEIALALHQDRVRVVNLSITLAKNDLSKSCEFVPTDLLEEY